MTIGRPPRIYLSPPHLSGRERTFVDEAFDSNWIAPVGPQVDAFEDELAEVVGANHAVVVSSGTAALHLALRLVGVCPGDEVLVSTLTFVASVNPVRYLAAEPVLIDSELRSWNMDPALVEDTIRRKVRAGHTPRAVVPVHLYGQCADLDPILAVCEEFGIPVIEDAAESLGATHRARPSGTLGRIGVFSFNGNKIITTSGGGALVTNDPDLASRARSLAAQARDPVAHYEHSEVGYNYRLSNVLAGIGRAQLEVLRDHVQACRRNFDFYRTVLSDIDGVTFQPEAPWGTHTRWLTALTIDPAVTGVDRDSVRQALEDENIEARPVWKPMHRQVPYADCQAVGGAVADALFERGLCLPSGPGLSRDDLERVTTCVASALRG